MKTINLFLRSMVLALLILVPESKAQMSKELANESVLYTPATEAYSSANIAVGLRAGSTSGITLKKYLGAQDALEGIIGLWNNAFGLTLLYERNVGTGAEGLNWYYGAGGHASFYARHDHEHDHHKHKHEFYHRHHSDGVGLGIDGILGLEYFIPRIPFAVSLDIKPYIEVASGGHTHSALDPGLGVKVTF